MFAVDPGNTISGIRHLMYNVLDDRLNFFFQTRTKNSAQRESHCGYEIKLLLRFEIYFVKKPSKRWKVNDGKMIDILC